MAQTKHPDHYGGQDTPSVLTQLQVVKGKHIDGTLLQGRHVRRGDGMLTKKEAWSDALCFNREIAHRKVMYTS